MSRWLVGFVFAAGLVFVSSAARADDSDTPELIPPSPPAGFDSKQPLAPDDLKRKNTRGYVTGLPLANFDPNTGFGGGVRGYYYWNGDRDDPLFAYTPYLYRVFLQFFVTTGGLQFHWLDFDAPAVLGTPYRLRTQLIYMRNTEQHFYGTGESAMAPLSFTGAGRSYDSFSAYDDAISAVRPDGTTLARYDHFDIERPIALVSVERSFLSGLVRTLVGLGFTHSNIDDYTGQTVEAVDPDGDTVDAIMGETRLAERCAAGLIGCAGGWDNFFRLGIAFDTRDFEPDPNNGYFVDAALDIATRALGSDYGYYRFMVAARYYRSLLPSMTDLVLGLRGTFLVHAESAPFFTINNIPYTDDPRTGLGGLRTLRGYSQDRFLGRVLTFANAELRWTFYRFKVLKQKIALMLVPFVDVGRSYDEVSDITVRGWRRGQGAGFRLSWNLATVIMFDYGFSSEDSGLYINFSHQF